MEGVADGNEVVGVTAVTLITQTVCPVDSKNFCRTGLALPLHFFESTGPRLA